MPWTLAVRTHFGDNSGLLPLNNRRRAPSPASIKLGEGVSLFPSRSSIARSRPPLGFRAHADPAGGSCPGAGRATREGSGRTSPFSAGHHTTPACSPSRQNAARMARMNDGDWLGIPTEMWSGIVGGVIGAVVGGWIAHRSAAKERLLNRGTRRRGRYEGAGARS